MTCFSDESRLSEQENPKFKYENKQHQSFQIPTAFESRCRFFTVGFDGIRVDPNETLAMTLAPGGSQLSFTSSSDGETPEVYYAVDNGAMSNRFELDGAKLQPGKILTVNYNVQTNVFNFYDNDGDDDQYDVDYTVYNPDGTVWYYETDNIDFGTNDFNQMDFGDWDCASAVGVAVDAEGAVLKTTNTLRSRLKTTTTTTANRMRKKTKTATATRTATIKPPPYLLKCFAAFSNDRS